MIPNRIKVLIAKVGLDGHEMGARLISRILMEAGMEVILTGKFQTAEKVVKTAIDEDADVIALSDHCGVMRLIASDVIDTLKKYGKTDICVVAGGVIPPEDIPLLESIGVTGNFGPGTPLDVIIDHVTQRCASSATLG